jgi:protein-tyrosine phosphatase
MSTKILMVCLGNICRSPLAEGILASKLPNSNFYIDSAGTGNWHIGKSPDHRSIAVAKKNGIDISKQKCRQFAIQDFENFDIIYAMDASNFDDLMVLAPNKISKQKVKLILDEVFPNENVDVPDPYYGTENGFNQVFLMLDEACQNIANKLLTE